MQIENKKVFVTGGGGFIGTNLVNVLSRNNKVTIFDNFYRSAAPNSKFHDTNVNIIHGDVLDYKSLRTALRGHDTIIHCAGVAGINTVGKSPVTTMKVNIQGTFNLFEAIINVAPECERVVLFSTSEVFGDQALQATDEDNASISTAWQSRWSYATSKLAEEHIGASYFIEKKIPTVILRPFNIFGVGQIGEGAIKGFINRALENKAIQIFGDGSQIRSWCYVSDMVDGIIRSIASEKAIGESFNIGNPSNTLSILELAQKIVVASNSASKIQFEKKLQSDIQARRPDIKKPNNFWDSSQR